MNFILEAVKEVLFLCHSMADEGIHMLRMHGTIKVIQPANEHLGKPSKDPRNTAL